MKLSSSPLATTAVALVVPVLATALAGGGCGGSSRPAPVVATPPPPEDNGERDAPPEDEDDGVEIVSTQGKLDPEALTRALTPHAAAIDACYADNVGRRRWLGGGITLRWDVGADGTLAGVRLMDSDLGAWSVEKCVLDIARGLDLGKPRGGKAAHVTNSLSFSLGGAAAVWGEDESARAMSPKLKELGECAKKAAATDPTNVRVTVYVGTRGKVQSVGFSSPTGFDDAWADCAHGRAMAWALPDPRGKVAKASIVYNPSAYDDEEE